MSTKNSKQRFSSTIDYYHKFRPTYPEVALNKIVEVCALSPFSTIADIGAGTGIFSKLLIERGFETYAVEPNQDMRLMAEAMLSRYEHYHSIDGSAENTDLDSHLVDCITCAQSFHWFNNTNTRTEFKRILKPSGNVVLIWNLRDNTSPFMKSYESLLQKYGTDYKHVAAENLNKTKIQEFFNKEDILSFSFPNQQILDWTGFQGRLLSTSYTPKQGEFFYDDMLENSKEIFDLHQANNKIRFDYNCCCFLGRFL